MPGAQRGSGVGFKYTRRTAEDVQRRQNQTGSDRKPYINDRVPMFRPQANDNTIRILPPTFPDATHYGMDLYVHYGVGAKDNTIICPLKQIGQPCAVCDEHTRASTEDDADYTARLEAKKRVLIYLVDRKEMGKGLQCWPMPWTLDRDIATISMDKQTKEVFYIDDPKEGYDVTFTKRGTGRNTEYMPNVARRPSPLDNYEALKKAMEIPLTDILVILPYDEIAEMLAGGQHVPAAEPETVTEDAGVPGDVSEEGDAAEEEGEEASALTWVDLVRMKSAEELTSLADEYGIELEETTSLRSMRREIAAAFAIEVPSDPATATPSTARARLQDKVLNRK